MTPRPLLFLVFLVLRSGYAEAQEGLAKIVGGWANERNSLAILKTQFGWDIWLDDKGRGRITLASSYGANIAIAVGSSLNCYYYVSILDPGNQMILSLKSGDSSACPSGQFSRTDDFGSISFKSVLIPQNRPAKNRWDLSVTCPQGGHFQLRHISLRGGRYADGSMSSPSGSPFAIDVNLGFESDNMMRMKGFAGTEPYYFEFQGTRQSDANLYSGGGTWGNDKNCGFSARFIGEDFPPPIVSSTTINYRAVWDLSVDCPNNTFFHFYDVTFINGRAAVGWGSIANGIHEWSLFGVNGTSIRLSGYTINGDATTKLDVSASPDSPDGALGTPYSGGGTYGSQANCRFKGRKKS